MSLLASQSFIEECSCECDVDQVEPLGPQASALMGVPAKAVPPTELTIRLPQNFVSGATIKTKGPFGEVVLKPPPGVPAGQSIRFRLGPPPQLPGSHLGLDGWPRFKVTVPPWARGGYKAPAFRAYSKSLEPCEGPVPSGRRR